MISGFPYVYSTISVLHLTGFAGCSNMFSLVQKSPVYSNSSSIYNDLDPRIWPDGFIFILNIGSFWFFISIPLWDAIRIVSLEAMTSPSNLERGRWSTCAWEIMMYIQNPI